MNYLKSSVIAALALCAVPMAAQAQDRVADRQAQQGDRIARGIESGLLSPREANRLQSQQSRIERYATKNSYDGGGLSRAERATLQRMQKNAGAAITRRTYDSPGKR